MLLTRLFSSHMIFNKALYVLNPGVPNLWYTKVFQVVRE